jgi:poly-gamma-glutamate capsule biosynthesis protein CapA/YwtB (metallophosphatase superfamily)
VLGKLFRKHGTVLGPVLFCVVLWLCGGSESTAQVRHRQRGHSRHGTRAEGLVTLRAVGDIMLAGPMEQLMAKRGRGYPFALMKPTLRQADIAFGNLECSVANGGEPIEKQFTFRADPRRVRVLAESGFTIVSVANNHAWDYGRDALLETVRHVRRTGVLTVGAGANRDEAHQLQIIVRHGVRVGFLAYLGLLPALIPESDDTPSLSMASDAAIQREVRAARDQVDVLIVSLHAGKEGAPAATPRQKEFARAAIDAGADMVIGHHPHVRQPLVRYNRGYICYSLGNFVFSTTGRGSGAMLEAKLSKRGVESARLIPLALKGPQPSLPSRRRHPRTKSP